MIAKIDTIIDKLLDKLADEYKVEAQFEIASTLKKLIEARQVLVNGS